MRRVLVKGDDDTSPPWCRFSHTTTYHKGLVPAMAMLVGTFV